jgi:hypothetical protein
MMLGIIGAMMVMSVKFNKNHKFIFTLVFVPWVLLHMLSFVLPLFLRLLKKSFSSRRLGGLTIFFFFIYSSQKGNHFPQDKKLGHHHEKYFSS